MSSPTCICPTDDRVACIEIRYKKRYNAARREPCECACHEEAAAAAAEEPELCPASRLDSHPMVPSSNVRTWCVQWEGHKGPHRTGSGITWGQEAD